MTLMLDSEFEIHILGFYTILKPKYEDEMNTTHTFMGILNIYWLLSM